MVSGSGEVTVYKYNERGEIESVYYPYSESLELAAKKEALEAGLYPKYPEYEWYAYSGEESILIKKAFERIYKNLPYVNLRGQHVWSEHYTYDNNSNRITKTTQYGTINYTYDDENRLRYSGREKLVNLEEEIGGRITFRENDEIYHAATNDSVSYSTNSLRGTRFTYDKNGNMLSSENLYSVKFFDYNSINRMKLSTVTDLSDHSYTATTYAYDGFGRRTLTQTEGHTATRTLYDGTGFEILRQGTADSNGSFVNYTEAQNRYSPYYPYRGGGYYGNRYGYADYFYYLFFGGIWGFGNGGHGSKNGQEEAPEYLTIENMYPLYANRSVSGTFKEDLVYSPHKHYWNSWTNLWGADTSRYDDYATYKETLYFGTDVLGSVRTTSSYSVFDFGSINYDVFGSPYRRAGSFLNTESLDFGYLGKPYNATTELYDYGFRDYSPRNARFTTQDPIRDGRNWYAYCGGDPINYTDPNGLTTIVNEADGHVLDVQRDGDTSILAYPYTPDGQRCEGPAQYYGKTMYEDSFISPDTGKPVGVIYPNQSIDQKMAELSISAGEMGYTKTWYESRSGGKLDIKAQMPGHEGKSYHGFKYNGYVISLREAGNILAGQNAAYYNMSYEDFQKGAGALQQKGLVGAAKYKIFGTIYGPAPYYGENEYQYRCSLTGYNQTMTGIFSPVNIFSFSIKGK